MGKWFDSHLATFTAEAEKTFGANVVVAVIQRRTWLKELAAAPGVVATRACIPQLAGDDDYEVTGWFGTLEVSPDTEQHVLIRRISVIDDRGCVHAAALAAAHTRDAINRALEQGRSLWLERRRNEQRVQDARGRDLEIRAVAWDDICLPSGVLDDIRANVVRFAGAREMYQRLGLPFRRGLLFYGPPGNGKTLICRAIATTIGWPVVYVSPDSHTHSSEELEQAFSDARELAPCVLWFDDLESLFDGVATMSNFLNRLDGATSAEGTLILATTNRPEKLDPALVARPSRFDRIFEIPVPGHNERDRFLARLFGERLPSTAREELVRLTSGMSMAFLQELFVGASLRALERGAEPNEQDAFEVHAALARHVRAAERQFEENSPAGFVR